MKKLVLIFSIMATTTILMAQEDLLKELEQSQKRKTQKTFQTFNGTRLVNGHTVESKPKHTLEFIFQHRFGAMNQGAYELWGLDQAYVRLGLDYGISDNLSASIGRNSVDKTLDGYLKFKLLKQKSGSADFPVTVTILGGMAYKASPKKEDAVDGFETIDRLAYTTQLLIARKFNSKISLQIMPSYVHKNAVDQSIEKNNQFALGFGGRLKITKSMALTSEYYYNVSIQENAPYYNSLGLGIDLETGGHVFQLLITNAIGLTERAFITETRDNFFDGDIHLGFNVTRTFQTKKNK